MGPKRKADVTVVAQPTVRATRSSIRRSSLGAKGAWVHRLSTELSQSKTGEGLVEDKSAVLMRDPALVREPEFRSSKMASSLELNVLEFLKGSSDPDDKFKFLEAIYAMSVVPAIARVPTKTMYKAIFRNIQDCLSVELTMASYHLLKDLSKRHPQVASKEQPSEAADEVWSPLEECLKEIALGERSPLNSSSPETVSLNLFHLVKAVAGNITDFNIAREKSKPKKRRHSGGLPASDKNTTYMDILGQFVVLEYLVNLIQRDFCCWLTVAEAGGQMSNIEACYMYKFLKILCPADRKGFLLDLVTIMDPTSQENDRESSENSDLDYLAKSNIESNWTVSKDVLESNEFALLSSPSDFGELASNLLILVMKIDNLKESRDLEDSGSRQNSRFFPDMGVFSHSSTLESFLKALDDPSEKLKFIVEYFSAYAPKLVVGNLEDCSEKDSTEKLLACFKERKRVKSIVNKFKDEETLPTLLAHAFQAFLVIHSLEPVPVPSCNTSSEQYHQRLIGVCQSLVTAIDNLQKYENHDRREDELLPIAEQTKSLAECILQSQTSC